ncbi:EAL domain-containing protein [Rhodoferax sp.]|uniref:sensor domain-containing protein n=1 Tax=Rhodoferax sp. TaxID=50421 RepID=UPI0025F17477|nr:EAL domain-containing protein [Rhodoferax sp.]
MRTPTGNEVATTAAPAVASTTAALAPAGRQKLGVAARMLAIESEIGRMFERVPFGCHTLDAEGTYQSINALELAWLGYTSEEIIGKKKLTDFLTPASQEKLHAHTLDTAAAFLALKLELVRRDGGRMSISLSALTHPSCDPKLCRALIFDQTETRALQSERKVSAAVFESLAGMFITDRNQRILQVNQSFTELTGYTAQEAQGQTPRLLSSGRHTKGFYQAMWAALMEHGTWNGEIWNRRKNGEIFVEWLSISTVTDLSGAVTHYVGSFIDITDSKRAQDQIAYMAYHDALTQLPNRRLLLDRLNQALATARRSSLHGAILFIDLDNFKHINDTCGHETGDRVLVETANRLRNAVREGDSVARLGGDEFAILLEDLSSERMESAAKAGQLAEKIRAVLAQPYLLGNYQFHCSASIGVDLYAHTETATDLLQHADLAMYQSKKAGRNTLRFFDPTMQTALSQHIAMKNELRQAIHQRQLRLFFQPQIDHRRHIIGAEALVRWPNSNHDMVSPTEFIPLAEESDMILQIGQWVLETACIQLKAWENRPLTRHLRLSINVSAKQFHQSDFVAMVKQVVADSGVNPALIKLEVTESVVLKVADAITKMDALRAIGVHFAMDDFGTGYSSLSTLTKLPLNQLKIDQSFVRNIGLKPTDAVIVQTIIAMAHMLNIEAIAEGVETEEQLAFLERHGCDCFQGFLFGRPVPIEELEAQLVARAALVP